MGTWAMRMHIVVLIPGISPGWVGGLWRVQRIWVGGGGAKGEDRICIGGWVYFYSLLPHPPYS